MSDKPPTIDELWPECPECGCVFVELCHVSHEFAEAMDCMAGWYLHCEACDLESGVRDTIEAAKAAFEGMRE